MPNIGFTIHHLAFSFPLGVALLRVIIILTPPGQCSSECWSNRAMSGATRGNFGLAYRKLGQSGVP